MSDSPTTASGIEVGNRVRHKRDSSLVGTVRHVDHGHETFGATTCKVEWDDTPGGRDINWTNRLEVINDAQS